MALFSPTDRRAPARRSLSKVANHKNRKAYSLAASSTSSQRLGRSRIGTCSLSAKVLGARLARKVPQRESIISTTRLCLEMKESKKLSSKSNVSTWRSTMRRSTICWTLAGRRSCKFARTMVRPSSKTRQKSISLTIKTLCKSSNLANRIATLLPQV